MTCSAIVALGSNLGSRASNINTAIRHLAKTCGSVVDTSFLYETDPQLVLDQPSFLNAACKIQTDLAPLDLLCNIKQIEQVLGRDTKSTVRYGPRVVDLDILFYNDTDVFQTETLSIPHERIPERDFVLQPLCDLDSSFVHPITDKSISSMLEQLGGPEASMRRVLPVVNKVTNQESLWKWQRGLYPGPTWLPCFDSTLLMAIVNATPDSFSDGGSILSKSGTICDEMVDSLMQSLSQYHVDILDVGGESTRPGADEVSEEQELERVIPVIQAIRNQNKDIPISIDTRKARVAKASLEAGANIINDVSGGTHDPNILNIAAEYGCPIILMHMRGDPSTMNTFASYDEYPAGVIGSIQSKFKRMVTNAQQAGIPRWNIITDPGIGFAKDLGHNLSILKHVKHLSLGIDPVTNIQQHSEFPMLVGASRKRFIGELTGKQDPTERDWGTAATTTMAVVGGAAIVRVHNYAATRDVIAVSDAIHKS